MEQQLDYSIVIPVPAAELAVVPKGNYMPVRYNAVKHGILSTLVVLPHEDEDEYINLLEALTMEHLPSGPTEMHLIEELAGIMWRKRRVLLAEGAAINRGLHSVATDKFSIPAKSAVPFGLGMPDKPTDMQDLMDATPEQVAQSQKETQHESECLGKATTILRKGGPSAYEKALKVLPPDSRDWWKNWVEEEEYEPNSEGLAGFINKHLWPLCVSMEKEARHHHAIKAQTLGEGLKAERLEKLSRYETHLDRKFERTLAMLVKLKELRRKE
jgi:hypothetical protein